jgi:hypothetical protein
VLLRNKEVFQFWKRIGLTYMFLGIEALDEDGLRKFRKRIPLGRNLIWLVPPIYPVSLPRYPRIARLKPP